MNFTTILHRIRPKDHMGVLLAVLPARYSPLQASGNDLQSVYLTQVPQDFAEVLAGLIGPEARPFMTAVDVVASAPDDRVVPGDDLDVWEHRLEERVASDTSIKETDREAIIRARRGQGVHQEVGELCGFLSEPRVPPTEYVH